jgi:hypothetical protein
MERRRDDRDHRVDPRVGDEISPVGVKARAESAACSVPAREVAAGERAERQPGTSRAAWIR